MLHVLFLIKLNECIVKWKESLKVRVCKQMHAMVSVAVQHFVHLIDNFYDSMW